MIKLCVQILFLVLMTNIVNAQDVDIVSIDSKFDSLNRIIKIWKPDTYNSEKPTQVIFVFDADYLFNIVTANIEFYSKAPMDKMPQTLVVGVYYKNISDRM